MSFNVVLTTLPFLIFVQGVFLAAAVFSKRQHGGNVYLAVLIAMLSLHGLLTAVWVIRDVWLLPQLYVVFSCMPFFYGPLVYRYVWHSLYSDWQDQTSFWLHSAPALVNLAIYSGVYVYFGDARFQQITFQVMDGHAPWYVSLIEGAKVISGLGYTGLILWLIRNHWTALKKWSAQPTRKRWFMALLWVLLLNWVLVLFNLLIQSFSPDVIVWTVAAQLVAFMAFFYLITFFAIRYPLILEFKVVRDEIRKKLNLDEGFLEETYRRLKQAEESKFFLDTEIKLAVLAKSLGLHANALSYILNDKLGQNFRDYVNQLRIDEFLKLSENSNTGTQLDRVLAAGFSSNSTFLRAFKKRFECTPAQYFHK